MPSSSRLLRRFQSLPLLALRVGLASGAVVLCLQFLGLLQPLDLWIYDWQLRSLRTSDEGDPRFVLIGMTEADINRYRWPISDARLAELLGLVAAARPRAIGLDIYRDLDVGRGQGRLNDVLASTPAIVVVTHLVAASGRPIPPPRVLAGSDQVGFNDLVPDDDGVVRRALLFQDDGDSVAYAFALRLALRFLEQDGVLPEPDPTVPEHLKLGPTTFVPFEPDDGGYVGADAGGYQVLLDYRGRRAESRTVSLEAVLSGAVDPGLFQGKVVLFGVTAESVPDLVNTPVGMLHGVGVHAHVTSQLLRAALEGQAPLRTLPEWVEILWTLAWGLVVALAGLWLRSAWHFAGLGGLGLAVLVLSAGLAFEQGWWLPPAAPGLTWLLALSFLTAAVLKGERADRALLRQLFGQHLSEKVAAAMWTQRERFLAGGRPPSRQLTATVLFMDLTGYTAVSEAMPPQRLIEWLDSYLRGMSRIIEGFNGFVDDYAGDAVKANFFDPTKAVLGDRISDEETAVHARSAVACALALAEELRRQNAEHEQTGSPTVGMRVGICTGPVVAGTVGSTHRMKYTTVGDTVNIAARLESLDHEGLRERGGGLCRILIAESTARCLQDRVPVEKIAEVTVKGRARAVTVYAVSAPRGEPAPAG